MQVLGRVDTTSPNRGEVAERVPSSKEKSARLCSNKVEVRRRGKSLTKEEKIERVKKAQLFEEN